MMEFPERRAVLFPLRPSEASGKDKQAVQHSKSRLPSFHVARRALDLSELAQPARSCRNLESRQSAPNTSIPCAPLSHFLPWNDVRLDIDRKDHVGAKAAQKENQAAFSPLSQNFQKRQFAGTSEPG